jgi:hypothetical protein
MNVSMMRQSTNGSHLCGGKCVLSGPSIPGVAISTSGTRSVMSASTSGCAAGGGRGRHHRREGLRLSSPRPCLNRGCETGVVLHLDPRFFAILDTIPRSMMHGVTRSSDNASAPFCGIAFACMVEYTPRQLCGTVPLHRHAWKEKTSWHSIPMRMMTRSCCRFALYSFIPAPYRHAACSAETHGTWARRVPGSRHPYHSDPGLCGSSEWNGRYR